LGRVEGSAAIALAEHAIDVSAATELGDGLVEGSNNRLYLRATTAAGQVLPKTELLVKRAWSPRDPGIPATTDEDGVAVLQLDPGPAVNVVIPPMPVRLPPRPPAVTRGSTEDLVRRAAPPLADQLAMDGWLTSLAPCARFVEAGTQSVTFAIEVAAGGAVSGVVPAGEKEPVASCLAAALRGLHLPGGEARLYSVAYTVTEPDLPRLQLEDVAIPEAPPGLAEAIQQRALDARGCLPRELAEERRLKRVLAFRTHAGKKDVATGFMPDRDLEGAPALGEAAESCVEAKLRAPILLEEASPHDAVGYTRVSIEPAARIQQARPQATTMLGYEFTVSAKAGSEAIGSTKLRIQPGAIPPLRLRATPVLAEPGTAVELAFLRGPSFQGELPKSIWVNHVDRTSVEVKIDPAKRLGSFTIPADGEGWYEASYGGARALVYVRPKTELQVALTPGAPRYAPGQTAEIGIRTTSGGHGTPAAVGLIGVDESLGQLVSLPGPEDMARLRQKVGIGSPAFGVLDAEALTMGRIRGSNAAAATIVRVTNLPTPIELDTTVSSSGGQPFDPLEALTDRFYLALGELYSQVHAWEEKAPAGEQMHPPTMAQMWERALAVCARRGDKIEDAYGRPLRLSRLPSDLLALTDPRMVVSVGTRLPEDVENWPAWVEKEKP
jgi:hypothetical protein